MISYKIDDSEVLSYLCDNSNFTFYSNPWSQLLTVPLSCRSFISLEHTFTHFYLDTVPDTESSFLINRTESNYQYFSLTFDESLMHLSSNSSMYFRDQDPQFPVDLPIISSPNDFKQFIAEPETLKLYESEEYIIGYSSA